MSEPIIDPSFLEGLSQEERDAIRGDDYTPEQRAALERIAAEGDDGAQGDAAPAPAPASAPPVNPLPADFDDQVARLRAEDKALATKLRDGLIDVDAYNAENERLVQRRIALVDLKTRHAVATEAQNRADLAAWTEAGRKLAERVLESDGFDYRDPANAGRVTQLNAILRGMADDPDLVRLPMDALLDRAHAAAMAAHGAQRGKGKASASAPPANSAAAHDDLADAAGALAAGSPDRWEHIDKLDGEAYEDALARMTPTERQRYQRGW